jgi:integrase
VLRTARSAAEAAGARGGALLKPACEVVGAPWAGFHPLRHTHASLQFAAGCSMLQLSRVLGHYSPAFTLDTYCHLLDDELAPALDVDAALGRVNARVNAPRGSQTHELDAELADSAA